MRILFLLLLSSTLAFAQAERDKPRVPHPASVSFDADSVYLGRLPYTGELISQRFDFKINPGGFARIEEIKPDCACGVAHYSKDTLGSGYMSYIMVSFEPYKPGPFEKRFAIKWQGQQEPSELVIKGYLEPANPAVHIDFPYQNGSFKMRNRIISFGSVPSNTVVKRKIEFFNTANYGIRLAESVQMPKYIEFVIDSPGVVPPQGIGTATIFLHTEMKNDFGYTLDNIRLFTSDPLHKIVDLNISAIIKAPDGSVPATYSTPTNYGTSNNNTVYTAPSAVSPAPAGPPQLWVDTDTLRIEGATANQAFIVSFFLYNRGLASLQLKHLESGAGCSVESIDKSEILKGQAGLLRLRIDATGKKGDTLARHITVHTNDPTQPAKKLYVIVKLQ